MHPHSARPAFYCLPGGGGGGGGGVGGGGKGRRGEHFQRLG